MSVYKIESVLAPGKSLKIYGSNLSYLYPNLNVVIETDSDTDVQRWEIEKLGTGVRVCSAKENIYSLYENSRKSPWNCEIFPVNSTDSTTSIDFVSQNDGTYKIRLTNYSSYFLTAAGTANSSNVYWGTQTNGKDQLWRVSKVTLGDPISSWNEYYGLSDTDLIARCIHSEAGSESDVCKRGVACVSRNRVKLNKAEFGGNTYSGVVLKQGQFDGMNTTYAMKPDTSTPAWASCVNIAKSISSVSNPIGNCIGFMSEASYNSFMIKIGNVEYMNFGYGAVKVTEKYILGKQVYFGLEGY